MIVSRRLRWLPALLVTLVMLALAAPASSAVCLDGEFELSGTVRSDINDQLLREVTSVGIAATDGSYADGEGTSLPGSTWSTCIPPGEYLISFFADSYMFEWHDDVYDRAAATPVVVSDAAVTVDASLGWATITGRVTDKRTEEPLFGSISSVDAVTGDGFDNEGTDSNGVYSLSVPPGSWVVGFAADFHWSAWYDNSKKFSKATVIEVTPFTPLITGIDAELKLCSRTVPDFCFPRNFNR